MVFDDCKDEFSGGRISFEVALLGTDVMLTSDGLVLTENRSVSGFGLIEWESPMPTCSSTSAVQYFTH